MDPLFPTRSPQQALALDRFLTHMNQRGFSCQRSKTKDLIYTFSHPIHKKTLAKLSQDKQGRVQLWLRFSASSYFSEHFMVCLIKTLEEDDYKYVGCYPGCAECDPPKGYVVQSPKGPFFRCHKELIQVGEIDEVPFEETLALIDAQHRFETLEKKNKVRD